MLSGPAILRISVLLIIAGILAAVVQYMLPNPAPAPAPVVQAPPAVEPAESPPQPSTPPPPAEPAPPPAQPSPPGPGASSPGTASSSAPAQLPADAPAFPPEEAAPTTQAQPAQEVPGQAEVDRAEDSAEPRALAVLDLNTASVADLNHLRGGGAIGRAIVAKRPYTSVDQLLSKRVLSRPVYERIKDQVTVR